MTGKLHRSSSLLQIAAIEAERSARSGRGFALVRIAPVGWAALDHEIDALEALVSAQLRRTDFVQRVREREVGAVLIETAGEQVRAPLARIRAATASQLPKLAVRLGWASVGGGGHRSWQEAWRWAGEVLVGDRPKAAA